MGKYFVIDTLLSDKLGLKPTGIGFEFIALCLSAGQLKISLVKGFSPM
jgi:hypothetical protein